MSETIEKLVRTIRSRKGSDIKSSYTSFLLSEGNDYCLNKLKEEVDELKEAIDNHDFVEVRDALADILYVVYGMGASYGVNLDEAFDRVHRSNMSKLCSTEQEAKDTVLWYIEQRDAGKLPYDSPAYRRGNEAGDYWVVYNENTGKILKNINYNAVNFKDYTNTTK